MNKNEGRVYFALDGDDFNPDEATQFLGMEPTAVKHKGSKVPGTVPQRSSWQLSTDNIVNEYIDVYSMSAEIVNKLRPIKDLILQAKERFNTEARLEVVLWISKNNKHSTPAIGFDMETVKFLGEIGASIDVDTYKH